MFLLDVGRVEADGVDFTRSSLVHVLERMGTKARGLALAKYGRRQMQKHMNESAQTHRHASSRGTHTSDVTKSC